MAVALSGSIVLEGSITGSLLGTASYSSNTEFFDGLDSSVFALTSSLGSFTSSLNDFSSSINTYTASNNANIAALNAATASLYNATASLYLTTASLNQYTASLNTRSASFACIDSTNNFACAQYFSNASNAISFSSTGSLYSDGGMRLTKDLYVSGTSYFNNVTVFGTQSINYITSSQLNIASNLITVNTATPSVRFGGLAVYDSGSLGTGLTGSILWDSENNHWVYSNPSGSSYSGGMFISGPRSAALGSEVGTTNNALMKGQGGDHITSSMVFEVSGSVGIGTSTPSYKLEVLGGTANSQIARFIAADYPAHSIGLGIEAIGSNWGASIFQDDVRRFTVEENGGILVGSSYQSSNAPANGAIIQGVVGIGSNAPTTDDGNLVVAGAVGTGQGITCTTAQINIWETTSGNKAGLWFGAVNCANVGVIGSRTATGNIAFQTYCAGWGERMRITYNGNVGIGTTTPLYILHTSAEGAAGQIMADQYGTVGSNILLRSARGTSASPTATQAGDLLGSIGSRGYDGSAFSGGGRAGIYMYAGENFTSTNQGTFLIIGTTALGAASRTERVRITTEGNVGIGTDSPGTRLEVLSRAADADRTLPHNVLTITAEQGNAPYGFFGGAILFKNRSYISGLVESSRIRSVIYDDGAPNNCGGGLWFETTPTPGGTLTPSLKINYAGISCFSNTVCVGGTLVVNGNTINVNCDTTTATDARINLYTRNSVNGDRASIYTYNLSATTAGCELTYLAFGYCCTNNQGYINMQTKSGGAWCNTMYLINGRVGIGTATPAAERKLTVAGGAQFTYTDNGGASFNIIPGTNGQDGADFNLSYYTGTGYGPLTFTLGGSERMRITSSGSVGIGTIVSTAALGIGGTGQTTANLTDAGCRSGIIEIIPIGGAAGNGGALVLGSDTWGNGAGRGQVALKALLVNGSGCGTSDLAFSLRNDPSCANLTERMRITVGGQLAIGTTSTSAEANLFLGARTTIEGGQMVFQKGTSCSCATHLDNYADSFRILVGDDTGTNGVHMLIDHKTRNACFYGTIIQNPATISNNNSPFGTQVNGGYRYFQGTLANGEKFGSQAGTYVQGFYFISWFDGVSGRGYAIYSTIQPTANAGTVLISSGGTYTASASYNASNAISFAFDGSNRGAVLSNNTGVGITFYAYVFGGV